VRFAEDITSENADMRNDKTGEKTARPKTKGFFVKLNFEGVGGT